MQPGLGLCPFRDDDEEEIGEGDGEAQHEADGGLFSLRGDAERDRDEGKRQRGHGKREPFVEVSFHFGELLRCVGRLGLVWVVFEADAAQ